MRKNKMMRAASGLLVAVLLTTCVISGTFAKYVTSAEESDSARVATWGFNDTSSIELTDLFKNAYNNASETGTVRSAETQTDVIAPGTTNTATFGFNYSGAKAAPEVEYMFKVDTTGSKCAEAIQNNKNIVWSLDGTTYETDEEGTSWSKLIAAIKKLSGSDTGSKEYKPGELPTEFNAGNQNKSHTIAWKWKFDKNSEDARDLDTKDTEMGNKAEADLDDVTLKISITAEQVD